MRLVMSILFEFWNDREGQGLFKLFAGSGAESGNEFNENIVKESPELIQ